MKPSSSPVWPPFTSLQSALPRIEIESAKGALLYRRNGPPLIDGVSSWWVNLHGHANPKIAAAISAQAKKLEHVIFAGFTHRPAEEFAKRLLEVLPGGIQKIFFSDDGSTAVEVALKLAVQFWANAGKPRTKIVALQGAYHGDTFGAMSAGSRGIFSAPFDKLLFEVRHIPFPSAGAEEQTLASLRRELAGGKVAAFIYEPLVQGSAGMRMYTKEILEKLLKLARSHETLLIADEVMTGFGRTGKLFASENMKAKPDLICLSKGITGGFLPMGATAISAKVVKAFESSDPGKTFFHGHSYTGNPLACVAALESLKLLMSSTSRKARQWISDSHTDFIQKISGHPSIQNPRSLGTILAMEFTENAQARAKKKNRPSYLSPLRDRLYRFFISRGVLLRPLGNTVYVLPPYVIQKNEMSRIYQAIREAADSL